MRQGVLLGGGGGDVARHPSDILKVAKLREFAATVSERQQDTKEYLNQRGT